MLYYMPVLAYLVASVVYQIVAKTVPGSANPFAMLSIVYGIATSFCVILVFFTKQEQSFSAAYGGMPRSLIFLGMAVIALEGSMIYAYRLGWEVSVFPTVVYLLAIITLLILGALMFGEKLTIKKLIGVALCVSGLICMRLK